ncbi:MAG: protease [Acidiferrobacteraceae bacterium]|jgi:putative protease|nr:protease [Acidiferrobacteraceae bacterium]MDP6397714.1 peptidase U32 family protein [Arenicellales bacterium]MDP6551146.1 peptidase U32 family protein [Arenicellales bacterium]MDP6918946.1 peptidase U32 family protein [Arenicellales bacterium]|tara:strand:+ start:71277 stop:72272 length:996 start_codon:yes stop_codon:yes gene_type:complete
MELVCPAGSLQGLKTAIAHGADAVYLGFRDPTNARHFSGLNFSTEAARDAVEFAHARNRRVFIALNTFPQAHNWNTWRDAVDRAAELDIDALIVADTGVMDYACEHWPQLRLHLSVQASATSAEAIRFFHERFDIHRAVLPRVLSIAQVQRVCADSPIETEVFGFGSLCVMVEGRCLLSSYVTGKSPNNFGACSPGEFVRWTETQGGLEARLNGILIDRYNADEHSGYPTVCKGRYCVNGPAGYTLEQPVSLNSLPILPTLVDAGVSAIKIEGRQRSPAYVRRVTGVWRAAIDSCLSDPRAFKPEPAWIAELSALSEGSQTTLGAFSRYWQ